MAVRTVTTSLATASMATAAPPNHSGVRDFPLFLPAGRQTRQRPFQQIDNIRCRRAILGLCGGFQALGQRAGQLQGKAQLAAGSFLQVLGHINSPTPNHSDGRKPSCPPTCRQRVRQCRRDGDRLGHQQPASTTDASTSQGDLPLVARPGLLGAWAFYCGARISRISKRNTPWGTAISASSPTRLPINPCASGLVQRIFPAS